MENIKDEIAQKHGYADFFQIDMTDNDHYEKVEIERDILNECVEELEKRISNYKFISVDERLPEEITDCVVLKKGNKTPCVMSFHAAFDTGKRTFHWFAFGKWNDMSSKVTHYIPLPTHTPKA